MSDKSIPQKRKHHYVKHGMTKTPEFRAWEGAKARCNNINNKDYHKYGGRIDPGPITVCARWLDKENGFINFFTDMGEKPEPKHLYSIDRINNDGNYEPGNCRWATDYEQTHNRRPLQKRHDRTCEFCKIEYKTQ